MPVGLEQNGRRPVLLFCGIPGSGKSSVARKVASKFDRAFIAQTDSIRGMILAPTYTNEESQMVYRMLCGIGREALKIGYTLLMDGTFLKEEYRREALQALTGFYSRSFIVWVDCDLETAIARNNNRPAAAVPAEQVRKFQRIFEPPPGAIRVDTSKESIEAAAESVLRTISAEFQITAG